MILVMEPVDIPVDAAEGFVCCRAAWVHSSVLLISERRVDVRARVRSSRAQEVELSGVVLV